MGFAGGSVVKNPPANAGDAGSIPGPGRSPQHGDRKAKLRAAEAQGRTPLADPESRPPAPGPEGPCPFRDPSDPQVPSPVSPIRQADSAWSCLATEQ